MQDPAANREMYLAKLMESLPSRLLQLHARVCSWLIRLEAACSDVQSGKAAAPPVPEVVRVRGDALFNGILILYSASRLFREVMAMHFLIEKRASVSCCPHLSCRVPESTLLSCVVVLLQPSPVARCPRWVRPSAW